MIPPDSSCHADIGFDCTNEELFKALEKMMTGSQRPCNVIDLNPYKYRPNNLPEGIWYLINSKENTDTECGFWKTEEEACEVFSDSAIIGRRTTLQYYDGQVSQECKTDWLMQVFSITQKTLCENSMAKEATMLCRVFLAGEKITDQNLRQKMSLTDTITTKQNNLTEQLLQKGGSNTNVGSTSESKVNKDDEIRALAVMERLTNHPMENPPEADILMEDYLELRDLDIPASPSSSSENSSCLTRSSGASFDSQDLEPEMDQVLEQRYAGYTFTAPVSHNPTEVVMLPATLAYIIPADDTHIF
ncbi:hypothetical protein SLEP1_g38746 [Rubroshorea leprosula]|uniref:NAC domain-containing protein n=1 Tax=Rubroshorea leprosula TaxID=152421 RepID=A0AAV5KZ24_9ROSI|nr:hypothetical protein SLEP1_g38746 [Rubroshorea leprosula]